MKEKEREKREKKSGSFEVKFEEAWFLKNLGKCMRVVINPTHISEFTYPPIEPNRHTNNSSTSRS